MKLKTYQARSMPDALARVKKELGPTAIILHTRTLKRGGLFGLGSRSVVEITATSDRRVAAFRGNAGREDATPPAAAPERKTPPTEPRLRPAAEVRREAVDPALRNEVAEIRTMVQDLLRHNAAQDHPEAPAELIAYYTHLIGQNVADEIALDIVRRVADNLRDSRVGAIADFDVSNADATQDPRVVSELQAVVTAMLPPASPLRLRETKKPTVVAMVGPTGVGKTTTIAKLAANMQLREEKRVGLVTIDAYRIAAVEQLKTYAQILKVPISSVLTPDEMRSAIDRMSDCDLILIDTAGRSQRDDARIAELSEFLAAANPDEVHLVLSTTSSEATIRQAVERFRQLGADHVVFTKLDEAVGFGVMLNVLRNVDMRLSYLTHGQAVPDDIAAASASRVARLIVGDADAVMHATAGEVALT